MRGVYHWRHLPAWRICIAWLRCLYSWPCWPAMLIRGVLIPCFLDSFIYLFRVHFVCLVILKNPKFQVPLFSTAKGEGYENVTWKWIRAAPNFYALSPSTVGKFFLELKSEVLYRRSGKETESSLLVSGMPFTICEIRQFHIMVGRSVRFWKFTHAGEEVVAPSNRRRNLRGSGGMLTENFGS